MKFKTFNQLFEEQHDDTCPLCQGTGKVDLKTGGYSPKMPADLRKKLDELISLTDAESDDHKAVDIIKDFIVKNPELLHYDEYLEDFRTNFFDNRPVLSKLKK